MDFIYYILTSIGIAHLIVDASVLDEARKQIKFYSDRISLFSLKVKMSLLVFCCLLTVFFLFYFKSIGIIYFIPMFIYLVLWKNFGSVVDCYLCSGTWSGFLMAQLWVTNDPLKIFACGCAAGFFSNFMAMVLNFLEASTIVKLPNNE